MGKQQIVRPGRSTLKFISYGHTVGECHLELLMGYSGAVTTNCDLNWFLSKIINC